MIQNIFKHFGGIEQYGLVSLSLFFLIFAGIVIWACLQKKSHLDRMSQIPLDTDAETSAPKDSYE
jgi:hypothetical protein